MGLVGWTVGLPLLPLRGVIWLGTIVQQRVDREMHDPTVARRQLEEVEEAGRTGGLSPEQQKAAEQEVTSRLVRSTSVGDSAESEG